MTVSAPMMPLSVLIMFLFGGIGIPLGVPPEQEDPLLARVAPEECLYYTTWAGVAEPDPNSPNQTEQLLAEPEIQHFLTELDSRLKQTLGQMARNVGDEEAELVAQLVPLVAKVLLTRPTAILVSELSLVPEGPEIHGAMVVNLGEAQKDVEAVLDKFRRQVLRQRSTTIEIGGASFQQFQPDPQAPVFTWGVHGKHFILGLGEGAVEGVLERTRTPAPRWLTEAQGRFPIKRRATLTYANLEGMLGNAMPFAGVPQGAGIIDALGVRHLKSYVSTTGLDETRFVSKTLVEIEGRAKGLLSLLSAEPLARNDLAQIPADSTVALAFRLDVRKLVDAVLETVGQIEPRAVDEFHDGLASFEQGVGIDIREDLLDSLGDVWQLYASPREGGIVTGWTAAVSVRDGDKLAQVHERLIGVVGGFALQDPQGPRIRSNKHNEQTIHSLVIPDDGFPVLPSWCITDDQLVFALFPQPIKAHLSRALNDASLADVPELAPLLEGDQRPLALGYQDTRTIFRIVYPLLQIGARMALGQMQSDGIDLDVSLLPSASSIGKHLHPGVTAVRRTTEGVVIQSHQTLPGGNVGATTPVLAAMLMPAVGSARHAARRNQSINNMRQIAIAMANYESAYRAFPAAYNTDKDGKPLLSWRVHILPFIEEQQLYEQFHLDEPWHSEHNRELIQRMPMIYRSPSSASEPGKTNYLGVTGKGAIMVPPKDDDHATERPLGTRIGDIRDGVSKTISVVEASDERAVIWTKPDDFQPDKDDPVKGLVGLQRGVFLVGFCDARVTPFSGMIDKTTLRAMFTRDGGEVTNE